MTRNVRKKVVYKDIETGKLIPKKEALNRDPDTWVEEEFLVVIEANTDSVEPPGDDEPPLLTDAIDAVEPKPAA